MDPSRPTQCPRALKVFLKVKSIRREREFLFQFGMGELSDFFYKNHKGTEISNLKQKFSVTFKVAGQCAKLTSLS